MTDRELLAKLEGYLAANLDRGLTPAQIEEALKMLREPTAPVGPTWPTPLYPSPTCPSDDPLPWWRWPVTCYDGSAPL
jgi:hypothetical protein